MATPIDEKLKGARVVPVAPLAVAVLGADPAAGAEVVVTVPAGEVWRLKSVSVANVQGATGTSQPVLQIDDGANVVFEGYGSTGAQGVTTTCRYTWAPGLPTTAIIGATTAQRSNGALPDGLVLGPGANIKTVTIGLSATTNYGVPVVLVEKLQ